jgi:hypothetical protein
MGSLRPNTASDPAWIRSLAMGSVLKDLLLKQAPVRRLGLIVSFEAPTFGTDSLNTANKVMHTILFNPYLTRIYPQVKILHTNAATLRSLLGLVQRGSQNKKENKAKAYTFIDQVEYPALDNDACDGVLLGMMGVWTAKILLGESASVPPNVLTKLTDSTIEHKGKGKNAYTQLAGSLHRLEYYTDYQDRDYLVAHKDAKSTTARLPRLTIHI